MVKNIQPQQKSGLNLKEHPDKRNKKNYKIKENDSSRRNTKDGELKPINKISENIHTEPAEEQQFEDNN